MTGKNNYWQSVRGISILAVVLIHALGGFNYVNSSCDEFVVLRQIINFAVAVFVFMAGYFVNTDKILSEEFNYKDYLYERGGRLFIPFVLWSLLYSLIAVAGALYHGNSIEVAKLLAKFIVGKAAVPFYYIVVLIQLTIITPWLVRIIKAKSVLRKFLWLLTPCYIIYLYIWNFVVGMPPKLYETFFPAWFVFYYLGLQVRFGMQYKSNITAIVAMLIFSCAEAFWLKNNSLNMSFYTSQITIGSFLYTLAIIGFLLNKSSEKYFNKNLLIKIGNCSYGIFYIHILILIIIGKLIHFDIWFAYWSSRFILTALLSFGIVYLGQILLEKRKYILKLIGFI